MFKEKFRAFALLAAMTLTVGAAGAADGLMILPSAHSVTVTTDRLEQALSAAGFRIFARIDHAAGAKSVNMDLPATQLLIFGKPKGGTALMQSQRSIAIDLPLKMLVWEDAGKVMIGWNDPAWLTARHAIDDRAPVVKVLQGAMKKFASEAAKP